MQFVRKFPVCAHKVEIFLHKKAHLCNIFLHKWVYGCAKIRYFFSSG